jgi:hypothetical protein
MSPVSLWQAPAELGLGVLFVWAWRKTLRRDAQDDSRGGVAAKCWREGRSKVGPLGKWSTSPLARAQRELDAMTKQYGPK